MTQVTGLNGPQVHAHQIIQQLLHQVSPYVGSNHLPPVVFQDMPGAYAETFPKNASNKPYQGALTVGHDLVNQLTSDRRGFALQTILHELAHSYQNPQAQSSYRNSEGGADAFARLVAPGAVKRSGLRTLGANTIGEGTYEYNPLVKAVLAHLGKQWVLHGQFAQPQNRQA